MRYERCSVAVTEGAVVERLTVREPGKPHRPCADLLSNYFSQRFIDSVLPARPGVLKVIENVPVNSQRDKLLGIRDGRTLWREFCGLHGCRFKRRFSHLS
jgi:hypothetical protein